MLRAIMLTGLLLISGNVAAQDSPVVEACKSAAAHYTMYDNLPIPQVQDFSELDPPRARLMLVDDTSLTLTCVFESSDPPLGLAELCFPRGNCFGEGDSDFQEVRYLLEQEGY